MRLTFANMVQHRKIYLFRCSWKRRKRFSWTTLTTLLPAKGVRVTVPPRAIVRFRATSPQRHRTSSMWHAQPVSKLTVCRASTLT